MALSHPAAGLLAVALLLGGCGSSFDRSAATRSAQTERAAAKIAPEDGTRLDLHPDPQLVGREVRAQAVRGPTLLPKTTPPPPG